MKPLRLQMQAFGPFATAIDISFDCVFDGGLFLLHGRTGAGKTTILDGLCFALFGRPSTPEREKDLRALRSDAAAADCQTEVTLIFAIGGDAYRIRRVPTQEVPKKRGEGSTELKGTSQLEKWSGTIADLRSSLHADLHADLRADHDQSWRPLAGNTKEVDLRVEELLGMNEKQFRQIVILPQGRFREFLSSTSTERQAILERLFQTDRFSRFQSWIATQAKTLEADWEKQSNDEAFRLQALGLTTRSELETAIVKCTTELVSLRPRLQTAREATDQWQRRALLAEHRESLKAQLKQFTLRYEQLSALNTDVDKQRSRLDLYRRFSPLFQLEARAQSLLRQFTAANDALAQLKALNEAKLHEESQLATKLAQLEAQRPSVDELEAERIKLQERYRELQEITKTSDRIATLKKERVEADRRLQTEHTALAQTRKHLRDLLTVLPSSHERSTMDESRSFEESLVSLHTIEGQFHLGEAARLSVSLKKGSPCPVCGSTHHPTPAAAAPGTPLTKADVEREQKRHGALAIQMRTSQATRAERLQTLLASFDELMKAGPMADREAFSLATSAGSSAPVKEIVNTDFSELAKLASVELQSARIKEKTLHELKLASAPLQTQINELEALRDERLNRIPAELRNPETIIERGRSVATQKKELETNLHELRTHAASIRSENASRTGLIRGKEEELVRLATEQQQLSSQLSEFDQRERDLAENLSNDEVSAIEKTILDHDSASQELRGKLDATNGSLLTNGELEELEALKENAQIASRDCQLLEQEHAALAERTRLLTELKAQSLGRDEAREELERRFKVAQKMNLLLAGDRSVNTLSVPLSRYVLQARFEACLEMANHRLLSMSRGQYQLRRPALSRNLTHSQGLNLSVEDSHTGRERPADSLSGGESFMAALALALGLSDVVQMDLGGIRLDSLFVDEGFGTLDSESLELAVRTLIDLQAGGRMVGIISHVQELQSQLPYRLEIKKTLSSSTATWTGLP